MSNPFQIPEQEQHELDQLGAELRDAMPEVSLSEDFHEHLAAKIENSWSIRSAFQNNRMIRMAAGLLVMTLAAAPVAAWVGIWPQQKKNPPAIGFEIPEEVNVDESGGALGDSEDNQVTGPNDEFEAVEWSPQRRVALERYNRLVTAVASYELHGQDMELARFEGFSDQSAWASASEESLWLEFARRCAQADLSPLSAELVARCTLMLAAPLDRNASKQQRAAYAAWAWLLEGEQAKAADLQMNWPSAPFLTQN
ncbi:MAG: hypothetical protein GY747_00555 [Planctomycetes bacterium]|nr:hypothetical protein [Planctomycetota bacterium]MCP4770800.1 hypothetical protein [Planctomycetota bacterium]MCP4861340.1 hypothetical protein [Planctomycetota bacterium]